MNIIPFKKYYDTENGCFFNEDEKTVFVNELKSAASFIINDIASVVGYKPKSIISEKEINIICTDELITKTVQGDSESVIKELILSVSEEINQHANRRLPVEDKLESIRNLLEELYAADCNDRTAESLNCGIDRRIAEIEGLTDAADLYKNAGIEPEGALKLKNLLKKIKNRTFSYTVTGEYKDGQILLYPKGVCEYARKKMVSVDSRMMAVFARELFKAYHHAAVNDSGNEWSTQTWEERSVIGSCASYYERIFSRDSIGDNELSDIIASGWKHHDFDVWSVSGAQYIERYDNWSHDLFRKIFMDSMYSWSDAHRDLIACERKTHSLPLEH